MTTTPATVALAVWLTALATSQAAQDVERVRTLYIAAAYEEALAAIPPDGVVSRELEQFRALCLLALGREEEAVNAVERLVQAHPTFVPPSGETSPRIQAIFDRTRAKLVPEIARQTYAEAKSAYDARNGEVAEAAFKRTVEMIDSLPQAAKDSFVDLRIVASGFLELSTALKPTTPPAPGPSAKQSGPLYVPPVAIREELPSWNPPDSASMRTEYVGVLRILIGADGAVEWATMVKSTHPAYDAAVLRAARGWSYKAATRGGLAVAAQKDIQIRLVPR